jgi:hypothetical protein
VRAPERNGGFFQRFASTFFRGTLRHKSHTFSYLCFDCQAAQSPWSSASLVGKTTQTPARSSPSNSALAQFLHPTSSVSALACVWRRLGGSRDATHSESLIRNADDELYCIGAYPGPRHGRNHSPDPRIGSRLLKVSMKSARRRLCSLRTQRSIHRRFARSRLVNYAIVNRHDRGLIFTPAPSGLVNGKPDRKALSGEDGIKRSLCPSGGCSVVLSALQEAVLFPNPYLNRDRNHMWSTVATEKTLSPKLPFAFSRVNRIQEFRRDNPG